MTSYFTPITQNGKDFNKSHELISRKRNPFNDKRLESIYKKIKEQMQKTGKIPINQISETVSQATSFYRFFGNQKVSPEEVITENSIIAPSILEDKQVFCIGDSSSLNMKKNEGHVKDFWNFGVLQDGKTPGFHAHASLALDAADGSILGLSDLILWNRPKDKTAFDDTKKEQRESYKWHLGASNSHKVLQAAAGVHYLFDREADDFDLFVHIKNHLKSDFTIRLKHNREVRLEGKKLRVSECLASLCVALVYKVKLNALDHYSRTAGTRKKRKAREATLELRFANVELLAPEGLKRDETLPMGIVEIREITPDLPENEEPLHWMLWTSKKLENASDALQIVEGYLLRWTIEQLFRTMKKKGFNQEATELGSVDGIMKQTATTFKVATQVMQLVNARQQKNGTPIEIIFNQEEQKVMKKINEGLQGNTEDLKNPFPPTQLSYGAWIIARLGGWKGYQSQKPPGPITMKIGLYKFKIMFEGYQLFNTS